MGMTGESTCSRQHAGSLQAHSGFELAQKFPRPASKFQNGWAGRTIHDIARLVLACLRSTFMRCVQRSSLGAHRTGLAAHPDDTLSVSSTCTLWQVVTQHPHPSPCTLPCMQTSSRPSVCALLRKHPWQRPQAQLYESTLGGYSSPLRRRGRRGRPRPALRQSRLRLLLTMPHHGLPWP